jgi:hypothetical protein
MVNVYLSGDPVHDRVLKAFYDGIPVEKQLIEGFKYEPSEVAVIFGVHKSKIRRSWPRGKVFRLQREQNLDVVVLETGYVNRGDEESNHYAAGFNGLNGRADFRNKGRGPERWEALNQHLRPYSPGRNVILCGQVPWDASVDHIEFKDWLYKTAAALKDITNRPIVFRPHPLAKLPPIEGCEFSEKPLLEDLKDAHCVVTFNSNSAVESLIYGKPVFAFDEGSMVWDVCNRNLTDVEAPKYVDRKTWAHELAWCQWTPEEMRKGLAWKNLFL